MYKEGSIGKRVIIKARKKIVLAEKKQEEPVNSVKYKELWKLLKGNDLAAVTKQCSQMIKVIEEFLQEKRRYSRATQMRKNMKRREQRFRDPDKKMLKLVINSVMQRYQSQQHIVSAEQTTPEGTSVRYKEEHVAEAITQFFREWMGSKVGVKNRWGGEGDTESEAWERMLDLDTSNMDEKEREFVEVAYMRSYRFYEEEQR